MATIQLPPLSFDDGGFRISIITGGEPSSDRQCFSEPESSPAVSPQPNDRLSDSRLPNKQFSDLNLSNFPLYQPAARDASPAQHPKPQLHQTQQLQRIPQVNDGDSETYHMENDLDFESDIGFESELEEAQGNDVDVIHQLAPPPRQPLPQLPKVTKQSTQPVQPVQPRSQPLEESLGLPNRRFQSSSPQESLLLPIYQLPKSPAPSSQPSPGLPIQLHSARPSPQASPTIPALHPNTKSLTPQASPTIPAHHLQNTRSKSPQPSPTIPAHLGTRSLSPQASPTIPAHFDQRSRSPQSPPTVLPYHPAQHSRPPRSSPTIPTNHPRSKSPLHSPRQPPTQSLPQLPPQAFKKPMQKPTETIPQKTGYHSPRNPQQAIAQSSQQPRQHSPRQPPSQPVPQPPQQSRQKSPQARPSAQDTPQEPHNSPQQASAQPTVPKHPISSMQDAFAESLEVVIRGSPSKPKLRELDAQARWDRLLAQSKDEKPIDARWRYREGQSQHEVVKLVAQISFGVYLLFNGMTTETAQVVDILQGHIDEVDEFLEITLEDLASAIDDLKERIGHLKVPMANVKVFEEMLEDRSFRANILDGNEKIEHVLARAGVALKQWDRDVDSGLQCTTAFTAWLNGMKHGTWRNDKPDLVEIFDAMKGNGEGWLNAFDEMNSRSQQLNDLSVELVNIVGDIERKAGEISRKTWSNIPPFTSPRHDDSPVPPLPSMPANMRSIQQVNTKKMPSHVAEAQQFSPVEYDDGLDNFPLPGIAPLLPPLSYNSASQNISQSPSFQIDLAPQPQPAQEQEEALYILQPRTYTPQPPEPLPSPRVRDDSPTSSSQNSYHNSGHYSREFDREYSTTSGTSHHTSMSPEPSSRISTQVESQPSFSATRASRDQGAHDSEIEPLRLQYIPRMTSVADLKAHRGPLITSPQSDFQHYRPVLASPHSPLQQRPHTATGPGPEQGHALHNQLRLQPSRAGGMSTLSTVASAYDPDGRGTPSSMAESSRTLKKKKSSAFGWIKKAFTMSDEERAAFEARKAIAHQAYQEGYYKEASPKFLDGRRLR